MQYHTNTHGPSEAGFKTAFLKAVAEAASSGTNEVLLSTHSLNNLQGVITSVFGVPVAKALEKTKKATVNGVTIFLETERIRSSFSKGVAFAPFVSPSLLAVLLADPRATDVVYVPWASTELADYVQNHPSSVQL